MNPVNGYVLRPLPQRPRVGQVVNLLCEDGSTLGDYDVVEVRVLANMVEAECRSKLTGQTLYARYHVPTKK